MNDFPRQILIQIIRDYGQVLVDEPRRVEGLLKDLCGEYKQETKALLYAMDEHVALDLRDAESGVPRELLVATLTRRLLDNQPMVEESARWAVESWAAALGHAGLRAEAGLSEQVARLQAENRAQADLLAQRQGESQALKKAEADLGARLSAQEMQSHSQAELLAQRQARIQALEKVEAELRPQASRLRAENRNLSEQLAQLPVQGALDPPQKRPWSFWRSGGLLLVGALATVAILALTGAFTALPVVQTVEVVVKQTAVVIQTVVVLATPDQRLSQSPTSIPTAAPTQPAPTLAATAAPSGAPPACTTIGQTWVSQPDGMTLVCVPAGKFLMGATAGDTQADDDERPQHEVTLDAFWIDRTEVTNAQFDRFVQAAQYKTDAEKAGVGYTYTGSTWVNTPGAFWRQPKGPGSSLTGRQNHPVVLVSWNDARAYCAWAGRGLPTEAQWEKAARGTVGRLYPWGGDAPDATRLNFGQNVKDTTEVGQFPAGASPYGALDMAGNAWEWVADWYGSYSAAAATNPTGPSSGDRRVLRGGSWLDGSKNWRSSVRYNYYPDNLNVIFGFRCSR